MNAPAAPHSARLHPDWTATFLRLSFLPVLLFATSSCDRQKAGSASAPGKAKNASVVQDLSQYPAFVMAGAFSESADLSALAVMGASGHGIMVSDELRAAQAILVSPEKSTITAGEMIPLFSVSGATEADLEGAAANPEAACYYAVGSHGASKKKGEFQNDRCFVFRIPADASGVPQATGIKSTSLLPWLRQSPFADSVARPLQQRGFNIEGLACKTGRLFIGVRGPNRNGNAFVLETAAEPLFTEAMPEVAIHEIALGAGFGIRELAPMKDGFLVLAGNAGPEPSKKFPQSIDYDEAREYVLWWWRPGNAAPLLKLSTLPGGKAKAEGLLVLGETDTSIKTLVIFDGVDNGEPRVLELTKPGA
ncbi:MAG: DUF3616 domain-containing protein [Verrucomicrobiales bacterium]|nr:DUF3616 domain-containing protein [Verrucomicrobiales bacterium]